MLGVYDPQAAMHFPYKKDKGFVSEKAHIDFKKFTVSDSGFAREICYNDASNKEISVNDLAKSSEKLTTEKYNFISFSGKLLTNPGRTVLWFGKRIHFYSEQEFADFTAERFIERLHDTCPICGQPKGQGLRFCYTEATGLPYEIFPCSKECLAELTHNISIYREILTELKQQIEYENHYNLI